MKFFYENFWVPFFGRILMLFGRLIEGEKPKNKNKQTYDLSEKN
tara:strand:- start:169 stop:300 length:132 start_codon:yes stop_codon:yes gene_type:complete